MATLRTPIQLASALLGFALINAHAALAPSPASGTVSAPGDKVEFVGGPTVGANASPASGSHVCVSGAVECEVFEVTLDTAEGSVSELEISVGWSTHNGTVNDFDIYLTDEEFAVRGSAASSANPEVFKVSDLAPGIYYVEIVPFAAAEPEYFGHVELLAPSAVAGGDGGAGGSGGLPECVAAFVGTPADTSGLDTGSSAVVIDPRLQYGAPETLILNFHGKGNHKLAAMALRHSDLLEESDLAKVKVFRNLPMLAVPAPMVTSAFLDSLQSVVGRYGLASIWRNYELDYALGTSGPYIRANQSREHFGVTGKDIGVVIVDSGIDLTQGDFGYDPGSGSLSGDGYNAKFVPEVGFIETPYGDTSSGHGTHVAGTVFGDGAMSDGLHVGMAPDAIKVGLGMGDAILVLSSISAYDFLLDPEFIAEYKIRVTNNSYGSISTTPQDFDPNDPMEQAIKRAYDAGIVAVFATGNTGDGVTGPTTPDNQISTYAVNPCSIGVGNGTREGQLAGSSLFGTPDDATRDPDIVAPGTDITAPRALTGGITPPRLDNPFYSTITGTSMATPHVAGAVALMFEAADKAGIDPSFEDIKNAIQRTAVPMVQPNGERYPSFMVGPGYIDVAAAIAELIGATAPPREEVAVEEIDPLTACAVPGLPLLEDPRGDIFALVDGAPENPAVPFYDLRSLHVVQPPVTDAADYRIEFKLKVESLAVVPNGQWPVNFCSPAFPCVNPDTNTKPYGADNKYYTIRMSTLPADGGLPEAPVFQILQPTEAGETAASRTVIPAHPDSGFDRDGTITLVASAADLGLTAAGAGTEALTAFQSRLTPAATTPDNMPDELAGKGSFTTLGLQACVSGGIKDATQDKAPIDSAAVGGSLGWLVLAPLMGAALRRRRLH